MMITSHVAVPAGLMWVIAGALIAGGMSWSAWMVKQMLAIVADLRSLSVTVSSLEQRVERIETHEDSHITYGRREGDITH